MRQISTMLIVAGSIAVLGSIVVIYLACFDKMIAPTPEGNFGLIIINIVVGTLFITPGVVIRMNDD